MIRFGACKCCEALRSEVEFLRSLIRPKSEPKFEPLPTVHLEADAVLGGHNEQIELPALSHEEVKRQQEIDNERARILAREY